MVPWILQHILVEIVLFVILVILLMDLSNLSNISRMPLEGLPGEGSFAMAVSVLIAASVYMFLCIMVASLHVMEQVQLIDRQMELAKHILRMIQCV